MTQTTPINTRELTVKQMKQIRSLLRYGDTGKIAAGCVTVGYQRVSDIIRGCEQHDEVWKVALEYLSSAGNVEVDERIAELLNQQEAA